MATITFQIANTDAVDVLVGLEREWADTAVTMFFPSNPEAYTALGPAQRGIACLRAYCVTLGRNVRLQRAREAVTAVDPVTT